MDGQGAEVSDANTRPLAVVTGASAGLGVLFARELAKKGYDLVIAARRLDRLEELAKSIEADSGITVHPVRADLSTPEGPRDLMERVDAIGAPLSVVINNAGFGMLGDFEEMSIDRQLQMIDLNIRALVALTHAGVVRMTAHGQRGYILNVGSLAGHQPMPYFAAYAATKAFVRDFSEAVSLELKGTPVTITCLEPGGTHTDFTAVAGMHLAGAAGATMMNAQTVVDIGLNALFRGRSRVVAGVLNKAAACAVSALPRGLIARVGGALMSASTK
jgi:short-subunit dehydrogenase